MLQEIQPASIFCQWVRNCQFLSISILTWWYVSLPKIGQFTKHLSLSPWICPHPCGASCRTEAPAPENSAAPAPWSPEPGTDIGWWPGPGVACELSVICHASNIRRIRIFSEDILTVSGSKNSYRGYWNCCLWQGYLKRISKLRRFQFKDNQSQIMQTKKRSDAFLVKWSEKVNRHLDNNNHIKVSSLEMKWLWTECSKNLLKLWNSYKRMWQTSCFSLSPFFPRRLILKQNFCQNLKTMSAPTLQFR